MRMVAELQVGRSPDEIISPHHRERWIFDLASKTGAARHDQAPLGEENIVLWSTALVIKYRARASWFRGTRDCSPYWNIEGKLAGACGSRSTMWTKKTKEPCRIVPAWHNRGVLPGATPGRSFSQKRSRGRASRRCRADQGSVQRESRAGGDPQHHDPAQFAAESIGPMAAGAGAAIRVGEMCLPTKDVREDYRTGVKFAP